jgi:hypothetical protein
MILLAMSSSLATAAPALADPGVPAPVMMPPSVVSSPDNNASPVGNMLAQNAPAATEVQPLDLTPVRLPERGGQFNTLQNLKTSALYCLPAKMFLNANVENSLRLETNTFQTRNHMKSNGVYRVLPDVTVGYAPTRTTRVYANYFMFRDTYMKYASKLDRTVHSVILGADKDFLINPRTSLTASIKGRELFITKSEELSDILPSVSMVRRVGTYGAVYSSILGQIRFQDMLDKYQEFDQFYSVGAVYRRPKWSLLFDTTLIDNFGKGHLRSDTSAGATTIFGTPGIGAPNSNHMFVLTLEADRRVCSRVPLIAFVRAQPIFNMGQEKRQGYAGFNLRLFGGLRLEISKPAIFPVKLRST